MAVTTTGTTRMQSFPFDSKFDGYDSDGYPVYDRAVGASLLRETFSKFFTNGVFPSPGTALNIGKADSGLAVTIQPGLAIMNGAMGGIEGEDPITLTLDTEPPQGNVCYSVFVRYDNTSDCRSLYFRTARGEPSSSPQPPSPDTGHPEVYEFRLGYVTVASNSTDLSTATVTNEKGTSICPYAAPFEEIDVSGVIEDTKQSALDALNDLESYIETNKEFIDSAIDGTVAGNLQAQINELSSQISNFDISNSVDNVTIEYTKEYGDDSSKLRVRKGSIGVDYVTPSFLADLPYVGTGQKAKKEWTTSSATATLSATSGYLFRLSNTWMIGSNICFDNNGNAFSALLEQNSSDKKLWNLRTIAMTKDGVSSNHTYALQQATSSSISGPRSAVTIVPEESGCTVMCLYQTNNYAYSYFVARLDSSGNVTDTAISFNTLTGITFNGLDVYASINVSDGTKKTFVSGFNQESDKGTYSEKNYFCKVTPGMAISLSAIKSDYGIYRNVPDGYCPYTNGTDKVIVPYTTDASSANYLLVNMLSEAIENTNISVDASIPPGRMESLKVESDGSVSILKRNADFSVSKKTIIPVPSMTFATNSMQSVQFSGAFSGFYYDEDELSIFVPGTKAGYAVNSGVANYAKNVNDLPSTLIGPNTNLDITFFENENGSMRRYNIPQPSNAYTMNVFVLYFGSEDDQ